MARYSTFLDIILWFNLITEPNCTSFSVSPEITGRKESRVCCVIEIKEAQDILVENLRKRNSALDHGEPNF